MGNLRKRHYICLVFAFVIGGALLTSALTYSTELSKEHRDQVLSSCSSAKNTLNQLHASDALLRVNMGQMYESMSTKLMSGFNTRVSRNDFNNFALERVYNDYNLRLDSFRADYIKYEEKLSTAINIDCRNNPGQFYDAVASARNDRIAVHDDVVELNRLVNQYKNAVDQFEKDYQEATGTN